MGVGERAQCSAVVRADGGKCRPALSEPRDRLCAADHEVARRRSHHLQGHLTTYGGDRRRCNRLFTMRGSDSSRRHHPFALHGGDPKTVEGQDFARIGMFAAAANTGMQRKGALTSAAIASVQPEGAPFGRCDRLHAARGRGFRRVLPSASPAPAFRRSITAACPRAEGLPRRARLHSRSAPKPAPFRSLPSTDGSPRHSQTSPNTSPSLPSALRACPARRCARSR